MPRRLVWQIRVLERSKLGDFIGVFIFNDFEDFKLSPFSA